jgi:two-component sensor histidine kinase
MSIQLFVRVIPLLSIGSIVLLTGQSCRQKEQPKAVIYIDKTADHHLIDSLIPACRAVFDSVWKDTSRKQTLLRGYQLMARTEKLAEEEQYQLDSVASAIEYEAKTALQTRDTARGSKRIADVKNIYRRTGNNKGLANAWFMTQSFYSAEQELPEKMAALDTAAQITLANKDTLFYLTVTIKRARIYEDRGQLDMFFQILLELLEFQKKYFPVNIPRTARTLAYTYRRNGQYNEALQYGRQAIDNLANDTNRINHPTYYQDIGYTYFDMAKKKDARKAFETAMELSTTPPYENREATNRAISWIVECYVSAEQYKEGIDFFKKASPVYLLNTHNEKITIAQNMLELYVLDGQFSEARPYAEELLRYDQLGTLTGRQQFSYELIGLLYLKMNNLANARTYILKALAISKKENDLPSMIQDTRQMFELDSTEGNYESAIRWYQEYKTLADRKKKNVQSKALMELDIKYETQKKAAVLQTLTEKNQLQQTVIQQSHFVKNLVIAIAVLLLLVLGILFSRYRLKQRVNKQLEENQKKINQQNHALENLIADERKLLTDKTVLLTEKTMLLAEKEWLVKEVHHRVKNSLQIVISLLNAQSTSLKDPVARNAIHDSQRRVHAVSLIHQKLYQSENMSSIHMPGYIQELTDYLEEGFHADQDIRIQVECAPVSLDANHRAVPLGLIINEAVTNAIKYGFPNRDQGLIVVRLKQDGDEELLLHITDNGGGFPAGFNWLHADSLGMTMMRGLSDQLDGTFSVIQETGICIEVRFPLQCVSKTTEV